MITREKVKAHLKRRKIEYIVGGITIQSLLFIYMGYRIGSFTSKQESVAPTVGVIGTDRIGKLHQLMAEADDTLSKQSPFWDRHIK